MTIQIKKQKPSEMKPKNMGNSIEWGDGNHVAHIDYRQFCFSIRRCLNPTYLSLAPQSNGLHPITHQAGCGNRIGRIS